MSVLAVVDSREAVSRARAETPEAVIVTDNPLLANAFAGTVENIDALGSQQGTLRLGTIALRLANEVDELLIESGIAGRYNLDPEWTYTAGVVSRTFGALLHRGAALARALARHRPQKISMFLADLPAREPGDPFRLPRFGHPARVLAERGFFGDVSAEFLATSVTLPKQINDTASEDSARRIALFGASVIAYESIARLGAKLPSFGRRIVVGETNEAARETLPWLAARGFKIDARGALQDGLKTPADGADQRHYPIDPLVAERIGPALREGIADASLFDGGQIEAIAVTVLEHICAGLAHTARKLPVIDRRLEQWFGPGGGILLTNGLFGPAGAQAYGLCRRRGIRVVEFEHGVTAGISALTDFKIAGGRVPRGDLLMVCSDNAARAFRSGPGPGGRPVAIGLPDCERRMHHRPLQRRLARRVFGLAPNDFCVMHVSTLLYAGNFRPGHGTPSETTTFEFDRTLLEQVYAGLRHRVIFKQYPTQRFPFEPDYGGVFKIAPNIEITKDEDFRYIRGAADAIVTMSATSTLGWCLGAEKPLIWLDSKIINALSRADLREAFREAFLFVDADQPDWPAKLRGILDRSPQAIVADWQQRAPARERLLRDVIYGPGGSTGRRAARLIAQLAKGAPGAAPSFEFSVSSSGANPSGQRIHERTRSS